MLKLTVITVISDAGAFFMQKVTDKRWLSMTRSNIAKAVLKEDPEFPFEYNDEAHSMTDEVWKEFVDKTYETEWEVIERRYDRTAYFETGEDIADALTDYVNSYTHDKESFVNGVTRSHRTLQQSVMRLVMGLIEKWADDYDKGWYDGRNESTCRASKAIVDRLNESERWFNLI